MLQDTKSPNAFLEIAHSLWNGFFASMPLWLMVLIGLSLLFSFIAFCSILSIESKMNRILNLVEARLQHDAEKESYCLKLDESARPNLQDKPVESIPQKKSEFWRLDKVPFRREKKEDKDHTEL